MSASRSGTDSSFAALPPQGSGTGPHVPTLVDVDALEVAPMVIPAPVPAAARSVLSAAALPSDFPAAVSASAPARRPRVGATSGRREPTFDELVQGYGTHRDGSGNVSGPARRGWFAGGRRGGHAQRATRGAGR